MKKKVYSILFVLVFAPFAHSQKKENKNNTQSPTITASDLSDLSFRLVGPALTSGRISDIAIHPTNPDKWYLAAASGGVWMTENHGTTFSPIFDNYGSFSIGCLKIAPSNPSTIWVGTGENNNQRSVAYGDGVYKSLDGGVSFVNMGLKKSEHIGNIIVHPSDENTVWVAAYGPVWSAGGERGVYKTTDGGKTWQRTLYISEETGISEIAIDPSNPSILYAAAHQRRRHEWTYIGGGPESALYKSEDGGMTWREISAGLPTGDMGRIGIAVAPADANYIYAIIEGRNDRGGFYRSTNKGENWEKMSGFSTSGNYYQELICDPINKEKVFAMDTYLHHTEDGGKHFKETGEHQKHVDNHALWINPNNTNHWIVGTDGGIYETYNHAQHWKYYTNLPLTQFYKVTTDNDSPFYSIYGGTQDNNSMGGPSQTTNVAGVLNSDWFITNGGDGFESATDPLDPNITYAQAQYGWLVRYDKKSGEKIFIQPLPGKDEAAYRWNWDAPLLVSPHDNKTLYFAANKVFKTTNRGDEWRVISPDLSQQIDRNSLKVMGQVWSIDAVMKNASTTIYGNIVALDESPKKKGLLYAGTDDGLVQVSENDGENWTKINAFPGVPNATRVNMLTASLHDEQEVFAVFNNHRSGDFKPYLYKSNNKGKTWTSISSNLPERGSVYCLKQDHIDPNLLFVGTEFGAYFSTNGGQNWTKLSGLPTIAVYDLDIQKRENDLVAATFGRGMYVLHNYSLLRNLQKENLNKSAHLFPVKDALLYVQSDPLGLEGTGFQGANLWTAPNPEFGAVFHLYIRDEFTSLKSIRQKREKELEKDKKDVFYPSMEELRKEVNEENATLIWRIKDANGIEVRRLISQPKKGLNKITWDLRGESTEPFQPKSKRNTASGFLLPAGSYSVEVMLMKHGKVEPFSEKIPFQVNALNNQTLVAQNNEEVAKFRAEVAELKRKITGSSRLLTEAKEKIGLLKYALTTYPNTDLSLLEEIHNLEEENSNCSLQLWGDKLKESKEFEIAPSLWNRIDLLEYMHYNTTTGVTGSQKVNSQIVLETYTVFRSTLNSHLERLAALEKKMEMIPMPYTKSQDSNWKKD